MNRLDARDTNGGEAAERLVGLRRVWLEKVGPSQWSRRDDLALIAVSNTKSVFPPGKLFLY